MHAELATPSQFFSFSFLFIEFCLGAGFSSNQMFLFGQIDMQIKLVPGDSAGTVVAYYVCDLFLLTCCVLLLYYCFSWMLWHCVLQLTSDQPNRDELDFEFLGNVDGKAYILQTNVFADGFDNREERINLWFDPTEDFHTYSILWNLHQIV